ncbi:DUF1636 domain-containing protein [Defluviimonas sp. WL0002]|uniref:DUF1636 domain-containing protein n=1 Tax=Albidovulum marisflavi TaxID=2984159 RepID=A0ABT2Z9B8_9RHOB|nr:DUF1636 domain-containing protein [Defluviimonas sp. WL0002]MCV2867739.1 DUF1636 domain-containing protein [Defluviimonas sp. WL0002]
MTGTTVTVCMSCGPAQGELVATLATAFRAAHLPITVRGTECMSGCSRSPTLAVRAPGKTAYLFGDVSGADLPDLLIFARMYLSSPDGNFADARPLGALRTKAIARIPG